MTLSIWYLSHHPLAARGGLLEFSSVDMGTITPGGSSSPPAAGLSLLFLILTGDMRPDSNGCWVEGHGIRFHPSDSGYSFPLQDLIYVNASCLDQDNCHIF
jgi:hypothetical protein